jgi:hypothetical protein
MKNLGYDPNEIENLKKECQAAGYSFAYLDESYEVNEEMSDILPVEFAEFQFVGTYEGSEVIYDVTMCTLRLHSDGLIYELAEKQAIKSFPLYIPPHQRDESYKENEEMDEEVELVIMELMEEIEESEEVKVMEFVKMDTEVEYGIVLDAAINVEEITADIIEKFIQDFKNNTLKLDETLYSFKSDDDDEE